MMQTIATPALACPHCPDRTPIVSGALAERIFRRIDPAAHKELINVCADWLTRKDDGLSFYLGIRGRAYTSQEKAAIATDQHVVAGLPCPFQLPGIGCGMGGYCSQREWTLEDNQRQYGFLPTLLLKFLDARALEYLIDSRHVADAKIAATTRRNDFPIVVPSSPFLVGEQSHANDVAELATVAPTKREVAQ